MATLLHWLQRAGAQEQAAALADRVATHVPLDDSPDPWSAERLLYVLWEAGADEQANTLADRLPGAGMFGLFRSCRPQDFRYGREADGHPAAPWGWEDLDLGLIPHTALGTETEEMT